MKTFAALAVITAVLFSGTADARSAKERANADYSNYRKEVDRLTEKTYKAYKPRIDSGNLRGRVQGYDLDHRTSVKQCFNRGMSASACAAPDNLQMLPSHINRSLGCKSAGCR